MKNKRFDSIVINNGIAAAESLERSELEYAERCKLRIPSESITSLRDAIIKGRDEINKEYFDKLISSNNDCIKQIEDSCDSLINALTAWKQDVIKEKEKYFGASAFSEGLTDEQKIELLKKNTSLTFKFPQMKDNPSLYKPSQTLEKAISKFNEKKFLPKKETYKSFDLNPEIKGEIYQANTAAKLENMLSKTKKAGIYVMTDNVTVAGIDFKLGEVKVVDNVKKMKGFKPQNICSKVE